MRMSGKGKSKDADTNEKSMVLMSLLWKRGTRMEFSGHAHGQTQSLGHSGYSRQSGEGRRQNGDRETSVQVGAHGLGLHLQLTPLILASCETLGK